MRSRTPDRLCAEAVDVALAVTREAVGAASVGEHLGVVAEGDRVVTHLFACTEPAYRGWRWATTLTRASRAKAVTIDETVLLPGPDSVLAPEWVPWSERLRPGDMGPGDLLPTEADDLRLEPGWTGDGAAAVSAAADVAGAVEIEEAVEAAEAGEAGGTAESEASGGAGAAGVTAPGSGASTAGDVVTGVPSIAEIRSVARQLGLGRPGCCPGTACTPPPTAGRSSSARRRRWPRPRPRTA